MYTVAGSVARGLLLGASFYEVAPEALLRAVGLDFSVIEDPDARVPYEKYLRLWEEAVARVDDPDFGLHLAENTPAETLSVVTRAVLASRTVGKALENYVRYSRIMNNAFEYRIDTYGNEALFGFRFDKPPYLMPRQPAEHMLALCWLLTCRIIGVDAAPNKVSLQHPKPEDTSEHRRIFGIEPEFNAPYNQYVFDVDLLQNSSIEADVDLLERFKHEADDTLHRLPTVCDYRSQIRQAIYELIMTGTKPTVALVSERVELGPSQMRAKLSATGVSFTKEVGALQRDLAALYLENKEWSITDVAFALGFRDVRSFADSFKRWTGRTPAEYRAALETTGQASGLP